MQTREIVEPDAGGFEDDETSYRVEDSDFMTLSAGDVAEAAAEPTHRAQRDVTHVRAALAAMSLMHPESIAEVMLKMLGRMPVERRAAIIAETMCTLDLEHVGRLSREGLLLIKHAAEANKPKIEALRRETLAAESALHYALDGLGLQAAE